MQYFSSLYDARRDIRDLSAILSSDPSSVHVAGLVQDLLTFQELHQLAERWRIAKLVHMGFPYRVIREKTGASFSTISRVTEKLQFGTGALRRACGSRELRMATEQSMEDDMPEVGLTGNTLRFA
jgi:TrpR-related protein YerC/YecD